MFIFLMRARAIIESFESRPRCLSRSCYGWNRFRAAEEVNTLSVPSRPGRSFRPADGSVARARRRCRSSPPCLLTSHTADQRRGRPRPSCLHSVYVQCGLRRQPHHRAFYVRSLREQLTAW